VHFLPGTRRLAISSRMLTWDRGTLVVDERSDIDPERLPGVLWDPRTRCWRAPAWRYRELAAILGDDLVRLEARPLRPPALRPYQESALAAWKLAGRRGIVVLPTGAGKTRTAIAALAEAGFSTLCIAPTRVLVHQWRRALLDAGIGPVGQLGDGVRDVERVTVATAASARAHAERLGHRARHLRPDPCGRRPRPGRVASIPDRGRRVPARLRRLGAHHRGPDLAGLRSHRKPNR